MGGSHGASRLVTVVCHMLALRLVHACELGVAASTRAGHVLVNNTVVAQARGTKRVGVCMWI